MQPVFDETLAGGLNARAFALRDFILVMREHQILAAEMQIKARTENLHAHGAALDVPAGTTFAPRTGPENVAVVRRALLPEREVGERVLGVFIGLDPFAGPHFVKVEFDELAVNTTATAIFFDAEIDRTVGGLVG